MNAENITVAVNTEVLTKVFLSMLNKENLINNKTYLVAVEKLEKEGGMKKNVD